MGVMCPVFKSLGVVPLLSMFLQMICKGDAMEFLVFWKRKAGNPSGPGADEGESVPISLMKSSVDKLKSPSVGVCDSSI